ncbi:unnamed protein product [Cylicocyclus nassatus]|uniref:PNPLA domain-containing protein n=1 Tax=Cylicocyclus nassatus TaxID=53992 RepID=A0AA36H5T5_CYLNA|nr:unnamed protein product [Cylicocyclus nassatus]
MVPRGVLGLRICPTAQRYISTSAASLGGVPTHMGPPSDPNASSSYLSYLSGAINTVLAKTSAATSALGLTSEQSGPSETKVTETTIVGVPVKAKFSKHTFKKRISRTEVTNKTRALVQKILLAEASSSRLLRIQELSSHIIAFPPTRIIAAQDPYLIANLLKIVTSEYTAAELRAEARQCLTLCGCQPPVKSRGVNLLSIDGGGTRGMMALEVLQELERISGKKICELFDYVIGVSTGSIIASLLVAKGFTIDECREVYLDVSRRLFSQNRLTGVSGIVFSHSYYDTKKWVKLLKEVIGEGLPLIGTSKTCVPRLAIIASVVNSPVLQPYVFRNYEPPAGRDSHYVGSTAYEVWQAIQASAAAPLYFEEVALGNFLLQDGGVIANNPTAIGVHEAKLLWPQERFHCVVSVGNGRTVMDFEREEEAAKPASLSSLQKFNRIVDSATNTEAVHMCMHDLLDEDVYYRLNPYMTYPYGLDEINPKKLAQMSNDAKLYVRRNNAKIEEAAARLLEKPTYIQRSMRWFDEWKDIRGWYSPR